MRRKLKRDRLVYRAFVLLAVIAFIAAIFTPTLLAVGFVGATPFVATTSLWNISVTGSLVTAALVVLVLCWIFISPSRRNRGALIAVGLGIPLLCGVLVAITFAGWFPGFGFHPYGMAALAAGGLLLLSAGFAGGSGADGVHPPQ